MSDLDRAREHHDVCAPPVSTADDFDVLCISAQVWGDPRWRQLMGRCARRRRVFFVEAARATDGPPRLDLHASEPRLMVATPYLPRGLAEDEQASLLRGLLDGLVRSQRLTSFVLWYDSPRTLASCRHLRPLVTVFDSDERTTPDDERTGGADLVFVRSEGIYMAGRGQTAPIYPFPSCADIEYFARARQPWVEPADQASIPRPRLGVLGAVDARLDFDLVAAIADLRADFHLVLLGDLLGVDPARLPRRDNIHYLGQRPHAQLPAYLAGWDVALLPYARDAGARQRGLVRPLEYLAAGKPVVATPLREVINPYGVQGLVAIADQPDDFVVAVDCELRRGERRRWLQRVDAFLGERSWDRTWNAMEALLSAAVADRRL